MATSHKLSLPTAILINLNIMMGGGIFINTVELSKRAGLLCGFTYLLVGFLILPLLLTISQLVKLHPDGGFFVFAQKEISDRIGFISTWSYFVAKLASASLMIHVSLSLITQIFPALLNIAPIIVFDLATLALFIGLNLLNMKTGSHIQMGFLGFKLIPVLFVIGVGVIAFSPAHLLGLPLNWSGVPGSLPFVLYAVMGFEAICSLTNKIENPSRNGPRAIGISFCIMLILIVLFQFLFYATLGTDLSDQSTYLQAFPSLLSFLFPTAPLLIHRLQALFHLAIAASALGGCYGILYSNNWNLHILAQNKVIKGRTWLSKLNSHGIPLFCIFAEAIFCAGYLLTTLGNQTILQQLAALGTTLTYTLSVAALWNAYKKRSTTSLAMMLPYAAFASCTILIAACLRNFLISGIIPLICFIALLIFGFFLYEKNEHLN